MPLIFSGSFRDFSGEPRWHWRNCRSIGFSFHLWIWPWALGAFRDDDVYGGQMGLHIGPLGFNIHYSIGNCSSYGLDRFTGLSEHEAYERALRYEGRPSEEDFPDAAVPYDNLAMREVRHGQPVVEGLDFTKRKNRSRKIKGKRETG